MFSPIVDWIHIVSPSDTSLLNISIHIFLVSGTFNSQIFRLPSRFIDKSGYDIEIKPLLPGMWRMAHPTYFVNLATYMFQYWPYKIISYSDKNVL